LKLPNYVKHYIDRSGKARFYYRRAGVKEVVLPGLPWTPEFMAAWEKANVAYQAPEKVVIGASRTIAGSVNAGLAAYYTATAFTHDLAATTQAMRRRLLERFRTEHGNKTLRHLERRHVQAYLGQMDTPAAQQQHVAGT
jgi:hypothetical protein